MNDKTFANNVILNASFHSLFQSLSGSEDERSGSYSKLEEVGQLPLSLQALE